jgi:hypothetical protein
MLRRTPCDRYRSTLIDFVDRRERGPLTPAALAHLDGCGRCRADLEATALAVMALRRMGGSARQAPVPATRWQPVKRAPSRRPALAGLGGALLAAAVASLILLPGATQRTPASVDLQSTAAADTTARAHQVSADLLPVRASGSAMFWEYGTFGLTSAILWPPSGPGRPASDPEASRFDLLSSTRRPGSWSAVLYPGATVASGVVTSPRTSAESI